MNSELGEFIQALELITAVTRAAGLVPGIEAALQTHSWGSQCIERLPADDSWHLMEGKKGLKILVSSFVHCGT